jgi:predicted acylesterase/phospholipase RssA
VSQRIVAVYSGGGAKAAAHLGAERALREGGLRPERYVACSLGSVVAAALALGEEPEAIARRMADLGKRPTAVPDPLVAILGIRRPALLKPAPLRAAFESFIAARRFRDLKHPLAVVATDLDSGELVVFGDGGRDAPLIDVLMASCALPIYLPPVVIDGRRYADGGVRSVVPLEAALHSKPDRIIAVDIGPSLAERSAGSPKSLPPLIGYADDALGILMADGTRLQHALWLATPGLPPLTWVRPSMPRDATFATDQIESFVAEGYRAMQAALRA